MMFRAGMELGLLNMALSGLGVLRRIWPFEVNPGRVRFMQWCANRLLRFGTCGWRIRNFVIESIRYSFWPSHEKCTVTTARNHHSTRRN